MIGLHCLGFSSCSVNVVKHKIVVANFALQSNAYKDGIFLHLTDHNQFLLTVVILIID